MIGGRPGRSGWAPVAGALAVTIVGLGCAPPEARDQLFAAMGEPMPTADDAQRERFERGRAVGLRRFTPSRGLGPEFSATFCLGCHEKPTLGGSASRYRDAFVRVGGGPQLEFQPHFHINTPQPSDGIGLRTAVRSPIPLYGTGLLAEVPADEIIARADPNDVDGDGISGRVNFERGFVGRFGRKAQMSTLVGFVRLALFDHLGVTSNPVEVEDVGDGEAPVELPLLDDDGIADPEIPPEDLEDLITFVALLAPPAPAPPTAVTEQGERELRACECTSCHVPALLGPRGPVPAYTDLLLHDLGDGLADGIEVAEAKGAEFRTQPLWGLAPTGPYLHDGRADTIRDAVSWHGGEADAARRCYDALARPQRDAVDAFLTSLGGHEHNPHGLLVPSAEDPTRFERGRALFDRDFTLAQGLGPRFNGDACRSCHTDPVVGGAGPAGVDVLRVRESANAAGPVAHRYTTSGTRPSAEDDAEYLRRQTPTILGLGLIDAISDDAIAANADPDDIDRDGIRGRVNVLPDGRVGRFGWEAQIPTLAEFARDALTTELGITVPAEATPFGRARDDDDAPDPEIRPSEIEDLVFFMRNLAAPRRRPSAPELEAQGEAVFERIGCAACHFSTLHTTEGLPVSAYTDLLLHDVATGGLLRTPPLWGLGQSPPYLHDGSAETIESAAKAHGAEANASVAAFTDLSNTESQALLSFLQSL